MKHVFLGYVDVLDKHNHFFIIDINRHIGEEIHLIHMEKWKKKWKGWNNVVSLGQQYNITLVHSWEYNIWYCISIQILDYLYGFYIQNKIYTYHMKLHLYERYKAWIEFVFFCNFYDYDVVCYYIFSSHIVYNP